MSIPQIMYVDDNKQKQVCDVEDYIHVGFGGDCEVTLDNTQLDDRHLLFFSGEYSMDEGYDEPGVYYAKNIGERPIFVHHTLRKRSEVLTAGQRIRLGTKVTFTIGRDHNSISVFWTHNEADLLEDDVHIVRMKVSQEKDRVFKGRVDGLTMEYQKKIENVEPNCEAICKATAAFFRDHFSADTCILYRRTGDWWKALASKRKNRKDAHMPSVTLFRRAYEEKTPIFIKIEDNEAYIEDEKVNTSLSIVESPANRVILIPLALNGKIFGMLYLDSKDEDSITQRDYEVLIRVLHRGGIVSTLSGYLSERIEELGLVKERDEYPKNWGWRFLINKEKVVYPLSCFFVDYSEHVAKIVYGYLGESLPAIYSVKSFCEGLRQNNIDTEMANPAYTYFQKIQKKNARFRKHSIVDVTVAFSEIGEEDEDGFVEIRLEEDKAIDHSLKFGGEGKYYAYMRRNGKIIDLQKDITDKDYSIYSFSVGDFLLISPLYRVPNHLLKNFDLVKLRRKFKDFFLIIREK